MNSIAAFLGTTGDFLLVVLGFGLIIFVHELGHFLAARWAGIRVLAFAIGFGPPLVTYRRGLGLRRGSSEPEYFEWLRRHPQADQSGKGAGSLSPTEYRVNILPLGGYVKMLGQDDLDPGAVSSAPDSYQNCKPWRRMIVISAGVVMNVLMAAGLFVVVFMAGLPTEPAKVGEVVPGMAASKAVATNGAAQGVTGPGLKTGDVILTIDGEEVDSFNDLSLATAMAGRDEDVNLVVQRPGVALPLRFAVRPEVGELTHLLEIGVEPARSAQIFDARGPADRGQIMEGLAQLGLEGVEPGMTLVEVGGIGNVRGAEDLARAVRKSGGKPVAATFQAKDGRKVAVTVQPRPQFQHDLVKGPEGGVILHRHLLGLTPVMKVELAMEGATERGLRGGDVFLRLGALEYPSITRGIPEIRSYAGHTIDIVVARKDGGKEPGEVALNVRVDRKGRIGFGAGDTAGESTMLALPPPEFTEIRAGARPRTPPAASVITRPGTRVIAVNGRAVTNFGELRAALVEATRPALERGASEVLVKLVVELPLEGAVDPGKRPVETVEWTIAGSDVKALHELGWVSPVVPGLFKLEETVLKAERPGEALAMGLRETHRVMLQTYLTFARLFQGTVKIEHLKGPVGIAHIGTRLADRGLIWLLFFMAIISINLAVINFLPLPIVDGGQFIFLVIEQVRGRPVPIPVQNAATVAGLIMIGSLFLIVTFNDIMGLFGR